MNWKVYFLTVLTWLIVSTAPAYAGSWKRFFIGLALYPSYVLHVAHLPSGYDTLQEAYLQDELDDFYFNSHYK